MTTATSTVAGVTWAGVALRRCALVVVAAVWALLVVGTAAAPASAHAVLEEMNPADGAALTTAPDQVRLIFDEPVTTPRGGVRVYDSAGQRVDRGDAAVTGQPEVVATTLEPDLGEGTYVTTYRITSADGHPLRGAALFTVGDGPADASLLAELFSADADRGAAVAAVVVRWLSYAAALLAGGGVLVARSLGPGLGRRREAVARCIGRTAVAAAALSVAGLFAQGSLVTGEGIGILTAPRPLTDVATSGFGLSTWVRIAGLAAVWWWTRRATSTGAPTGADGPGHRPPGVPALVGGVAVAVSFVLEGHTLTTSPAWLVVPADVVHLLAAAIWGAGLVVLALAIGRHGLEQSPLRTARLIARFSGLAMWSILALSAAGIALGWVEVRALRALTTTDYGRTLIVKLVLLLPVAAAAAYNHRRLVPHVVGTVRRPVSQPVPAGGSTDSGTAGPAPGRPPTAGADALEGALARLRRTVRIEIAGIIGVLAATAVLVGLQPAAEAAGISGAYSTYVALGEDAELNVTVDPNRAGRNEIHLYVLGPDGRQLELEENVTVELSQPSRDIGPLQRETTRLGPGHFVLSGPELSVPGRWEITVEAPVSTFDLLTTTVPVTVNPAS